MSKVHELSFNGTATIHCFRHEDQSGSLIGVTNEDGYRSEEYWFEDFGAPIAKPILFDGQESLISSASHDTPSAGQTTITLASALLTADQLNGAELAVAVPDDSSDRLRMGTVIDTTTTTIVISDAGTYDIATAIYTGGAVQAGFVVYDFNDSNQTGAPSYSTGGEWTAAPSNSGGSSGTTTFTDSNASFASYQIGWKLIADAELFAPLTITSTTSTTLVVAGDASTLAAS
ncbi:MAG: hypothetical protein OEY28_14400, partial [Nitrospira sp.]|nr:hypothetical protein [Nitrospira sp.]